MNTTAARRCEVAIRRRSHLHDDRTPDPSTLPTLMVVAAARPRCPIAREHRLRARLVFDSTRNDSTRQDRRQRSRLRRQARGRDGDADESNRPPQETRPHSAVASTGYAIWLLGYARCAGRCQERETRVLDDRRWHGIELLSKPGNRARQVVVSTRPILTHDSYLRVASTARPRACDVPAFPPPFPRFARPLQRTTHERRATGSAFREQSLVVRDALTREPSLARETYDHVSRESPGTARPRLISGSGTHNRQRCG